MATRKTVKKKTSPKQTNPTATIIYEFGPGTSEYDMKDCVQDALFSLQDHEAGGNVKTAKIVIPSRPAQTIDMK